MFHTDAHTPYSINQTVVTMLAPLTETHAFTHKCGLTAISTWTWVSQLHLTLSEWFKRPVWPFDLSWPTHWPLRKGTSLHLRRQYQASVQLKDTSIVLRTTRTVLISSFQGRQPTGDISHNPSSRMPLLSARTAVTFPASPTWPVPTSTAWWTEARAYNGLAWGRCTTVEWLGLMLQAPGHQSNAQCHTKHPIRPIMQLSDSQLIGKKASRRQVLTAGPTG